MTVQLTLSPELQQRLQREAERQQVSADAIAIQLSTSICPRWTAKPPPSPCSSSGWRKTPR